MMRGEQPLTAEQQAWVVLAELFRDTELDDAAMAHIARELKALGLDADTAQRMLFDDVMPVFGQNLLSVAGNWTGWRAEDVVELVRAWVARREQPGLIGAWHRSAWMRAIRRKAFGSLIQADWERVARLMSTA